MIDQSIRFTALRGMQAGREFYVVMCQLKLIPRFFVFDEAVVPAELRAQRTLNKARIPEIARYMTGNPHDYIFSAITASIDGNTEFTPVGQSGAKRNMGELCIDMQACFLINDGQHRRAAIEEALRQQPDLGDESIAVVFFLDIGLHRSQQMFADLNTHAVRPNRSISVLYNHRDEMAKMIRRLIASVEIFQDRVEVEKTSISNRSPQVFTLNGVYRATEALLRGAKVAPNSPQAEYTAYTYWTALTQNIPEWNLIIFNQLSAAQFRHEYVHAHGVVLLAFGIIGGQLIVQNPNPEQWKQQLSSLTGIDWRRTNSEWQGRAVVGNSMSKSQPSVALTVTYLKSVLNLSLSLEEEELEQKLIESRTGGHHE